MLGFWTTRGSSQFFARQVLNVIPRIKSGPPPCEAYSPAIYLLSPESMFFEGFKWPKVEFVIYNHFTCKNTHIWPQKSQFSMKWVALGNVRRQCVVLIRCIQMLLQNRLKLNILKVSLIRGLGNIKPSCFSSRAWHSLGKFFLSHYYLRQKVVRFLREVIPRKLESPGLLLCLVKWMSSLFVEQSHVTVFTELFKNRQLFCHHGLHIQVGWWVVPGDRI